VNRRAPIFAGVAMALLVVIAFVVFVMPKSGEISKAEDDLATAQAQEQSLRAQLASLQDAQEQAPKTRRQIQALENEVPQTADLPALIRLLREAADRAAVDLFQFAPSTPTVDPSGTFSVISTSVNVTGSYFSLDEFLFRLESLPRAAKVTTISLTPGASSTSTSTSTPAPSPSLSASNLTMQLTVEFYTSDLSAGPGSSPGPTTSISSTGA
jgi:Tfp pilus assembly protein PilO